MSEPLLLQSVINFIDVMASRGAIKGDELHEVGTIRNCLVDMHNFAMKSMEPDKNVTIVDNKHDKD